MQRSTTEDQFNVQWDVLSDSHHGPLLDPLSEFDHNEPAILSSQSVSSFVLALNFDANAGTSICQNHHTSTLTFQINTKHLATIPAKTAIA